MPWDKPDLIGWSIVGMKHYILNHKKHLFVLMSKADKFITAEGQNENGVFDELAKAARRV